MAPARPAAAPGRAAGRGRPHPAAPAAAAAAALAGCAALAAADPETPGGPVPACPTRALLGVDCPVCGTARMLQALARADLPAALGYNALGVVAAALAGWAWLAWLLRALGRPAAGPARIPGLGRIAVAALIAWTVLRLIPHPALDVLRP